MKFNLLSIHLFRYGISQKDLAKVSGISLPTIGRMVNQNEYYPYGIIMLKIANALGCKVDDLFELNEKNKK